MEIPEALLPGYTVLADPLELACSGLAQGI